MTAQQNPCTLWMTITWLPSKPLYTSKHTENDHHMTAQQTPVYKQAHWEWPSHDCPANPCIQASTLRMTITWLPSKPLYTSKHTENDHHMTAQQTPVYKQAHWEWPSHDCPANPCIQASTLRMTITWLPSKPLYTSKHTENDHHMTAQQTPVYKQAHWEWPSHDCPANPCIQASTLRMTITWLPSKPLYTSKHTENDHHMTAQQTPVYKQAHWEWPSHDCPANSCIHAHTLWITNLLPKVTWLTPNLKAWSRMPPHEMNALKSIFEKPCSQSIYTVKHQFCSEVYSWHQTSKLELWTDATAIMGPPSNVLEKRCVCTWGWGGGRCLERKVRERERERGCSKWERQTGKKETPADTHTERKTQKDKETFTPAKLTHIRHTNQFAGSLL